MNAPLLLEKQLDLLAILEGVGEYVYTIDRNWCITYTSKRFVADIAGGRGLIGMSVWDAFSELASSDFARAFRKTMADGIASETEAFYGPLGARYLSRAMWLPDGLAIYSRDVTQLRVSEHAVRDSEHRFRSLFETLTQGILLQRAGDGKIIDANPAAEQILGVTRAQLLGAQTDERRWQLVDEDGGPLPADAHPGVASLRTGEVIRGRIMGMFNPKENERRWLLVDTIPQYRLGETAPHQICALFIDITKQITAARALRASQDHLTRAQRVASLGSSEVDFRTGAWRWSDETYRIHGLDRETFTPSYDSVVRLVHADDRTHFCEDIEAAKRGVTPASHDCRIVRPDGEIRSLHRETDLRYDERGVLVGLITTKRDVTELRASERHKEELQDQLRRAQRVDALGTLAGGIAHDLNNTLVPVLVLTDLLRAKMANDCEGQQLIDLIQQAGERARDLVHQILSFSRGDRPERTVTDMAALVRETMRLVRAGTPTTTKILESISTVPPVMADPSQMHQVILNLVGNASRAIGDALGTITVALGVEDKEGFSFVRLSIADTGCGMDQAMQQHIFEPFFTTRPVGQGTGLGLSVVQSIIASHGGRIAVTSKTGEGSRFDVFLPVIDSSEKHQQKEQP